MKRYVANCLFLTLLTLSPLCADAPTTMPLDAHFLFGPVGGILITMDEPTLKTYCVGPSTTVCFKNRTGVAMTLVGDFESDECSWILQPNQTSMVVTPDDGEEHCFTTQRL